MLNNYQFLLVILLYINMVLFSVKPFFKVKEFITVVLMVDISIVGLFFITNFLSIIKTC